MADENPQIQALDRADKMLPMQPGFPERRTHDYLRHGTSTLFAALRWPSGRLPLGASRGIGIGIGVPSIPQAGRRAHPDHGSGQELHLIMDNCSAHKRVEVRDWLAAHPGSGCTRTPW